MSTAIECRGVGKEFGQGDARIAVLRGVDLEIPFGKITMIVGPSGCGKTTLLSVMAGLLSRSQGTLSVLGTDFADLDEERRILFRRQNLGFIFQDFHLLPALTAAENVAVPLFAAGAKRREAVQAAVELLARLDMEKHASRLPLELSGGQKQRVAIARALIHSPRILLCDEPTAALDHATGHTVMELLASASLAPERAVVVVTHDSRVFEFAHCIAHMEDGQITHIDWNESGGVSKALAAESIGF